MGKTTKGNKKDTAEFLEGIISEWRTVFDSITDMVSVLDTDHRFIRVNRPLAEYLGVEPQDVIGKKCYEVMHGTDKPVSNCPIAKSTNITQPVHKEVYDSTLKKYFMISLSPIMGKNGNVQRIVHVMRDISERKSAEIELRESEEKYRKIIETSNDAVILADSESGIILHANKKTEELLGISLKKIKGMHQSELHPENELENYRKIFENHVKEGKAFISDLLVVHKSGRKIPVDISASMIELGGRKILQGVFRDITNRKKYEEDLIIKNRAIESSLSAIGITDAKGKLLYANDSLLRMWGYEHKDEVLGRGLTEFWDGDRVNKTIENTLNKGGDIGEDRGKRRDGSVFDVQYSSSLIKDEKGQPQYFFGSFLDISEQKKTENKLKQYYDELEFRVKDRTIEIERTNKMLLQQISDRKEAEEALRESELRFRVAATTVTDLIWEGDVRDNSLKWYGDIDQSLGYKEGEFPRTISGHMESIHPDDREGMINSIGKALETGDDFRAEYRIRCNDGSLRYWDETGKCVEYENGKPVRWIGSVTDITDRKIVESQILKSEEQFKKLSQEFNALLDAIPDNITLMDSDLKILWANKATAHKFQNDSLPLEGQYCYKLYCNASTPCENCPVMKSFKSGREETVRRLSRSGIVWDIRSFPIKDEEGNVKNVIEVARDVSARVKLEQETVEMQAKLIHTNKMTSLGTLVSGVAHEINNPNSFIMTNADLFGDIWKDAFKLLNKLDDEYKHTQVGGVSFSDLGMVAPKLLRGIYDGSGRIKSIVDNLRNFARSDRGDLDERVDVNKAVRAASNILNSHIKQYTDQYFLSCRDNIPFIKGNSQQIEQVVINLIINSLQALTDRQSCVIVSTYCDNENDLVIIKVEDEGTGISESDMDRITEPFFTTKMESGGTGLGLSISYAVIKDHKGSLEFRSEKNKRTIALIKLPVFSDDRND